MSAQRPEPEPAGAIEVAALSSSPATVAALAEILIDTVANGGSVSFMHPMAPEAATAFWTQSLAVADSGGRVVLGATQDGKIVGTVTLLLDTPPNQAHRGEIAKMMTRLSHRGRGVARALMVEAERIARERGRTVLTLDTATVDGAAGFYEKLGFILAGIIPDYALTPHGVMSGTAYYWKRLSR